MRERGEEERKRDRSPHLDIFERYIENVFAITF